MLKKRIETEAVFTKKLTNHEWNLHFCQNISSVQNVSKLKAYQSRVSSHTEELWHNETFCLRMTKYMCWLSLNHLAGLCWTKCNIIWRVFIFFIFLTVWWLLFSKKLNETQASLSKFHELYIYIYIYIYIYLFIIIIYIYKYIYIYIYHYYHYYH